MCVRLDGLDDGADLTSGGRCAFGKLANLLGNNGEAAAVFAGADRLDCGVQSQHVGTAGDVRE